MAGGRRAWCRAVPVLVLLTFAARALPADTPEDRTVPRTRVVVGADPDYPPYEFLDASGQPAGFNVDLTRAIAETMGMEVEFRFGSWARIRSELLAGEIDVLQGISYSDARAKELEFAEPHAIVHHAIFARNETPPVSSIDELAGKQVIVFRGGIMDETLTARGFGADLVRTSTPADALRLLASGRHDYVAVALLPGMYILRERGLTNVRPVARRIAAERYGFAVKKGNRELLARFEEGLAILKNTGRYDTIHARWLGVLDPPGIGWTTVARYAALVLTPLLALLGAVLLWSRSLQRLVAQRTASLAREVAERERAAEQLRVQQQQLVQADKMAALGVLVAGVAHEINNPNGYMLLNMPTLKAAFADAAEVIDDLQEARPDLKLAGLPYARMRREIPQMLDEMLAGSRRVKHIVDDLKRFARREDAPPHEGVDLNEVARSAARLVENPIRKATHRFEATLQPGLPAVSGSAQRLEQVVVNLLLNACEALPEPHRAVRLVTRVDADAGQVVLEVQDEGIGIPPEHLHRITEPFFTTRRETGGTGLGLSVSAGIVKEHGGSLDFRSGAGQGTTVTLRLPIRVEGGAP